MKIMAEGAMRAMCMASCPAPLNGRGAGMRSLARELDHLVGVIAHDATHDADVLALAFQHRPLLDMRFDVAVDGRPHWIDAAGVSNRAQLQRRTEMNLGGLPHQLRSTAPQRRIRHARNAGGRWARARLKRPPVKCRARNPGAPRTPGYVRPHGHGKCAGESCVKRRSGELKPEAPTCGHSVALNGESTVF
jgi:hypothetical protein